MKKNRNSVSIDGFIYPAPAKQKRAETVKKVSSTQPVKQPRLPKDLKKSQKGQVSSPPSESFSSLIENEPLLKPARRIQLSGASSGSDKRPRLGDKKSHRWRRVVKWVVLGVILAALGYAGLYIYKIAQTSESVFLGGWGGLFSHKPLKEDAHGRTNILIFGTAEDSEGGNHGGAYLTDSIMIISINKETNDMAMVNLPRDLWIKHEKACSVGYQEKLNTVYFCGSDEGKNESNGAAVLMRKVNEIIGIDLHYYIHLNFGAVVGLVDAVGGVEVVIESPDRRGILDRNFDWRCNYKCYYVKYANGPTGLMDGEHALALIRARNAQGGYGLPNSNYDREKNQQKVLNALIEKTMKAGTLANYKSVSKILDAVGDNLRTNISSDEVRSMVELAKKADFKEGRSISLVDKKQPLVKNNHILRGETSISIVQPVAGAFDYSQIQQYLKRELYYSELISEAAKVGVYNASSEPGGAKKLAERIKEVGIDVADVGNATTTKCGSSGPKSVEIYVLSSEKPKTLAKLKAELKANVSDCQPQFNYDRTLDFLVIINSAE